MVLVIFITSTFGGSASGSSTSFRPGTPPKGVETSSRDSEYRIKALFLYRLARWITWPSSNLSKNAKNLTIGVVGKDPFGKELDLLTKLKPINKRKIAIKRFKEVSDIRKTQILFVSKSLSDAEVEKVIAQAKKDHVFVVGEKAKFVDEGGSLGLLIKDNKLKFEVNLNAIKEAKLKISSQILKMALRIIQDPKKKKK